MIKVFIAFVFFFVVGNDEAEITVLLVIGVVDKVAKIVFLRIVRSPAAPGAISP